MKTITLWFIIGTILSLSMTAAAKKTKPHVLDKYDHEMHTSFFEADGMECTTCHRTDDSYSRDGVDLRGCHNCHNNSKATMPGSNDCQRCHSQNVAPIKPHSHTPAWMKLHPTIARQNGRDCATCHSVSFCVDCHQQRDSVRQSVHPRNFRFFHSIDARANPAKCDRCHRVTFCTDCHTKRSLP